MKLIITGGAGFIGSAVIRLLMEESDITVINVDKLTYASSLVPLAIYNDNPRYHFEQVDICDRSALREIFLKYQPNAVMHLAAESHVDRSIEGPEPFVNTNIVGTFNLLEVSRAYWSTLSDDLKSEFRFHHVSTDEVFGSLGDTGFFREDSHYHPNSPYSASKAAADHLVRAWCHTYDLPIVITNCSNNYGPFQFPEKLIPLMLLNAIENKPLPIYGSGSNVRDWLYVEDHARALWLVLRKGEVGESYNIGSFCEKTNLEIVQTICSILDELKPRDDERSYSSLITFVADRPGHDLRYAIDATKISTELAWKPKESFESALRKTVQWYLKNLPWCADVQRGYHQRQRLGLLAN